MRIALLTHEPFYPPSGGGSAEAVYLVEEMLRRNHEVHVFCPKSPDPDQVRRKFPVALHQFDRFEMGRYTSLRNFKYLAYPFFLERMVLESARKVKFDLLMSQHAISAVAAGRLKCRLEVPVVMNFLDHLTAFMETWPPYVAPPPLLAALKRFELGMPVRYKADAVFTVSDPLAELFAACGYPKERLLPIYYGYDPELFRYERPSMPSGEPAVVVMHGSLDRHHLGDIAFGAIRYVSKARPGTIFRFVGKRTGSVRQFFDRVARRIPGVKLECTGFIPYEEVPRQLTSATVGMVPYEESTGTHCAFVAKVVECAGVGLPVVCTPLRGISRYFHDDPLVRFTRFDGEHFGRTITSWLDEPLSKREELGRRSSQKVRADLDWRVISRKAIDRAEEVAKPATP